MRLWLMGVAMGALVGGLVGALVVFLLLPSRAGAAPDEQTQTIPDLVVQRLRVVDVAGQTRGVFEVRGNKVVLALTAPNGWERVFLGVDGESAHIEASDPSASGSVPDRSAFLDASRGSAFLDLFDAMSGQVVAAVSRSAGPDVDARDSDGHVLWSAP